MAMVQRIKSLFKEQRGSVIIFYAIIFITLWVPFIGLVVEYGRYLVMQSQLQNAADAAVLSAAETMMVKKQEKNIQLDLPKKDYSVAPMRLVTKGTDFDPGQFNEKSTAITWQFFQQLIDAELNEPSSNQGLRAYRNRYRGRNNLEADAVAVEKANEKIILQNILNSPDVPTEAQMIAFQELTEGTSAEAQSFHGYYRYNVNTSEGPVEKRVDYYGVYLMRRMELPILRYIGAEPVSVEALSMAKLQERE